MFVYRENVSLTNSIASRQHGTLIDAGMAASVQGYWPVKDSPGFTRPTMTFPGKRIEGNKPDDYGSEFDSMYNAILAEPLDSAPRGIFADWIEERITDSRYADWPDIFRNFKGGWMPLALSTETVSRWDGTGLISQSLYGTWDTWIGASGQFVQACRSGLFTSNPITTCIVWDLIPMDTGDGTVVMTEQGDPYALASDTETYYRIALNDLCGHFMAQQSFMPRQNNIRGYSASNLNRGLRGISCAYVDLGRYAAGLPKIKWPEEVPDSPVLPHNWNRLYGRHGNQYPYPYGNSSIRMTGRKYIRSLIARE